MSFIGFEHKLLKTLRESVKNLSGQDIVIACSGGADSVALFVALNRINPIIKAQIKLLHIHHGSLKGAQGHYRDNASYFCYKLSKQYKVDFKLVTSKKKLVSEKDCRDFRHIHFEKYKNVFLGQHADDFMETVLIRMIRGAGPQGLVNPFSKRFIRPLIKHFNRIEILEYLKFLGQDFLEDPSNSDTTYLRNWLRNHWLFELKKRRGIKGLRRSFNLLHERLGIDDGVDFKEISFKNNYIFGSFNYNYWLSLSRFEKQSVIAHILLKIVKIGYTKGQIDEIIKHLDFKEKVIKLKIAGVYWKKQNKQVQFNKI